MTASTDHRFRPRDRAACRCVRGVLALALLSCALSRAAAADVTELSLEQLLDVTVVGASKYEQRQSEVAAAVGVITRQEIKAFGWRTIDEALASLPGIYTTYDRQYTYLGTRGFGLPGDNNTRVLVTIDGNRVNDPIFDTGPFGRQFPLDIDLIERIEFIPGPGGAVYGTNAMFGVVNIVTRSGTAVGGAELAVGAQSPQDLRAGRASWGTALDNGTDLLLSVSGMRAAGEDRLYDYGAAGVSGVAAGLDGENGRQFFAHAARGPWLLEYVHGDRTKYDPTGGYLSDPLVAGQFQRDRYDLAQLQFQDDFAAGTLQLSGRLFAGNYAYRSILSYGTYDSYPADGDWRGAEFRLVSTALAGHKLMIGVEGQQNIRQDQSIVNLADPAASHFIPGSGYRAGVYAQDDWRIGATLTATLGLRLDRNDVTGAAASPRGALIWQATPQTTLKTLYGRASRAPNNFECCYADGVSETSNPALGGERIDTLELVADQRVGAALALRASLYRWTMHGLITLGIDPASGLSQYQTGVPVNARGVELSADQTWRAGARLRGSVALQDATQSGGAPLLNSPKLLARLNLSAPLPLGALRAGYELRYDGGRRTRDGTVLGGYAISNLHLATSALGERVEAGLGVYNLFDKRYAQPGSANNWQDAIAQDGRSVLLTLSCRL